MLFAIRALDKQDATSKRQEAYPAHHAHLDSAANLGVKILMSGPLTQEDGTTPKGSLFIVEVKDRAAAEQFYQRDPFHLQGVWDKVEVHAFVKKRG